MRKEDMMKLKEIINAQETIVDHLSATLEAGRGSLNKTDVAAIEGAVKSHKDKLVLATALMNHRRVLASVASGEPVSKELVEFTLGMDDIE